MNIVVTGAAGFIGSAFVRHIIGRCPDDSVVSVDKLTYAGNLENLASVEGHRRHTFIKADICDASAIGAILEEHSVDAIVHFAAESHVDRSILAPTRVVETNVLGTAVLLEAARVAKTRRFLLVSTDEVYGSIDAPSEADETWPLHPGSPYAASKASADLLTLAYVRTYGLPAVITRASNNYGPYQFPEKLIPLMILNALDGASLPLYGDGTQVRDWLFVEDHCRALMGILRNGRDGQIYNIGGSRRLTNREVVEHALDILERPHTLITTVSDRPGHDRRYAISSEKLSRETGFVPQVTFEQGLALTVQWYRENNDWTRRVRSGEYREYYRRNYEWRIRSGGVNATL